MIDNAIGLLDRANDDMLTAVIPSLHHQSTFRRRGIGEE